MQSNKSNSIYSKIQKALGLNPKNTVSPQKAEHSQASHTPKKGRTGPTSRSPEICLNPLTLSREINTYLENVTTYSRSGYFQTPKGSQLSVNLLEKLREINRKLAGAGSDDITTSEMLYAHESHWYFFPLGKINKTKTTPERMNMSVINLRRIEDQTDTGNLAVLALLIVAALNIKHFETILSKIQTPGNHSTPTTQQEDTITHDDLDDIRRKLDLLLIGQSKVQQLEEKNHDTLQANHDILQKNSQILKQNQEMLDTIQSALDELTSNEAIQNTEAQTELSPEDKIEAIKQRLYIRALENGKILLSGSTTLMNTDVARKCAIGLSSAVAGTAAAALVVTAGTLFPPAAPIVAAICTYASSNALKKLKSVAHEHVEQRIKQKLNIVEMLTRENEGNINTLHTITETETGQNIIWLFQLLLNKIADNSNLNNLLDFIERCNTLSDLRVTLSEKIREIIGRDNQTYIVNAILSKILPAGIVDQANNTLDVLNKIKAVAEMIKNISHPNKRPAQNNENNIKGLSTLSKSQRTTLPPLSQGPPIPSTLHTLSKRRRTLWIDDAKHHEQRTQSPASVADLTRFQIST